MTKPSGKVKCDDCERKRDAHQAVRRDADGRVAWVCRQCWRDLQYELYMRPAQGIG